MKTLRPFGQKLVILLHELVILLQKQLSGRILVNQQPFTELWANIGTVYIPVTPGAQSGGG